MRECRKLHEIGALGQAILDSDRVARYALATTLLIGVGLVIYAIGILVLG